MCICVCIYIIFLWELPVYVCMALVAQWVKKICLPSRRCRFDPWILKIPWRRSWQPTSVLFPGKSMDRGAWWCTVHGITKEPDGAEWLNNNSNVNIYTHTHTHTLYICVYICTHIHTYTGNSQKKIKYKWNIRKDAQPHWGFKKCQSKQQQKKSFHQTNRHVLEVLQIWYWKENIKVRKLIYCWSKFKLVYTFGMQFGNVSTCSNVLWASPKIYPRNILIKATWYR